MDKNNLSSFDPQHYNAAPLSCCQLLQPSKHACICVIRSLGLQFQNSCADTAFITCHHYSGS